MTVSALFLALVVILSKLNDQIITLPTLSIAGIVLLLISLAAIAYVFVRTGLQDPRQALGLPAGSIQAVIALSLVVLFAILSVFIFTSMGPSAQRKISGLDKVERDAQMAALSGSFGGWEKTGENSYTIYVRDPGLDARNDVGKQLIVLIGTLMTSAVSFYFGSRATLAGQDPAATDGRAKAGPASAIAAVVPKEIRLGEATSVTITGTGLAGTTAVELRRNGETVLKASPDKVGETEVIVSLTAPPDPAAGNCDLVLIDEGGKVLLQAVVTLVS